MNHLIGCQSLLCLSNLTLIILIMKIVCPKCKGSGEVTMTNSQNYGLQGIVFTAGVLNCLDALFSQKWQEECPKCNGNGIIKL